MRARPSQAETSTTLLVVFLLGAASAWAMPTIGITSPAASSGPLYDVRPTITVAYTSNDPNTPLDLGTLRIVVNGVDWTGKFNVQPGSASYALSAQDALIAGRAASCSNACALTIQASITDTAGAQIPASTAYDIGPTLPDLAPRAALVGSQLTLSVLGIDPTPSHNTAVFSLNSFQAPLTDVDPAMGTGTLKVGLGASTGTVSVSVNGVVSPKGFPFTLLTDFPTCLTPDDVAWVGRLISMDDGSLFTWQHASAPPCPASKMELYRFFPKNADGTFRVVDMSVKPFVSGEGVVAIGVDKSGKKPVVVTVGGFASAPGTAFYVHYHANLPAEDHVTVVPSAQADGLWWGVPHRAEFDQEGNLYLFAPGYPGANKTATILKIKKQALEADSGTPQQLEAIAVPAVPQQCYATTGLVSCSGAVFLPAVCNAQDVLSHRLLKYDLQDGQVVSNVAIPDFGGRSNGIQVGLALDCQTDEVFGLSPAGKDLTDLQVWRSTAGGAPVKVDYVPDGDAIYSDMTVAPDGTIYMAYNHWEAYNAWDGTGVVGIVHLPEAKAGQCPCSAPCNTPPSAQPYCKLPSPAPALTIDPSTTRWKPQRGNDLISVDIGSTKELDVAQPFTLRYTGKKSDGTVVVAQTEITLPATALASPPQGYAYGYTLSWNHLDAAGAKLPAANYTLVVRAPVLANQSPPPPPLESPEYDKVSLVEVKKLEVVQCGSVPGRTCQDGGALLDTNKGPGGGKAAFPDAAQPGGDYQRTVLLKADLEPNLGADSSLVMVHFGSIDVDDPSASTAPIDDDSVATTSADNHVDDAVIVRSIAASPDQGGAAVSYFKVSTRQGNNYRLAASTYEPWLATLCGVVSAADGAVQHTPCNPGVPATPLAPEDARQVSEMLTVWRTLHLELKRMSPALTGVTQEQIQRNGLWTHIGRTWRSFPPFAAGRVLEDTAARFIDPPQPPDPTDPGNAGDHLRPNDWQGANVAPYAPDDSRVFRVARNSNTKVTIESGDMTTVAKMTSPPGSPDRAYFVRDDELTSLTNVTHDTSVLEPLLESVYIKVVADSPNPAPEMAFRQNLTVDRQEQLSGFTRASGPYWSVPVLLAFEGTMSVDHDPTHETFSDGRTPSIGRFGYCTSQPLPAVFTETLRDFHDTEDRSQYRPTVSLGWNLAGTLAHETFHALGLWHNGGIMCGSRKSYAEDPWHDKITPLQVSLLRAVDQPDVADPFPDDVYCKSNPPGPNEIDCCPVR